MATFRNPINGYSQSVEPLTSFLGCFFFGMIYFAYKGVWKHAFIAFFAAFLTLGISWLIYPFFAYSCVTGSYLERGWQRVGRGATRAFAVRRQKAPSFDGIDI